jgi:uncharacterized protein YjbI with pentapeptide repeats
VDRGRHPRPDVRRPVSRNVRPERDISLPDLTPFDGDRLEANGDYVALDLVDLDFAAQDAPDARFLECRLLRCGLDGASLRRARIAESLLSDLHAATVDFADSTWRDAQMWGGRLGAATLVGATWTGIRVRGSHVGFMNLSGARLQDVTFEGCEIASLDVRGADLQSVAFVDSRIDELDVAGATLAKVDLSGATLQTLVGVESLRGAIISHQQLVDLAPLLAAQIGIEVRPDPPVD